MNTQLTSLNQQAILLLVQSIQNDDTSTLQQFGLTGLDKELAEQLKKLNVAHLSVAPSFRGNIAQIKFDPKQLSTFIKFVMGKSSENDQIDDAIKAGVRHSTLEELKGISRREFAARRERLGLEDAPKGRPENLSEELEIDVLRAWQKLRHLSDPLERLLALRHEIQVPLDRAWLAIKQAE